jgi:hypothetical protein
MVRFSFLFAPRRVVWSFIVVVVAACSGPSEEKVAKASSICQAFIAQEMKGRRDSADPETKVFDAWEKNGSIVLEVGYRKASSDGSYSVRKCVLDEKKGTVSSPSPLNDSEWRK